MMKTATARSVSTYTKCGGDIIKTTTEQPWIHRRRVRIVEAILPTDLSNLVLAYMSTATRTLFKSPFRCSLVLPKNVSAISHAAYHKMMNNSCHRQLS